MWLNIVIRTFDQCLNKFWNTDKTLIKNSEVFNDGLLNNWMNSWVVEEI